MLIEVALLESARTILNVHKGGGVPIQGTGGWNRCHAPVVYHTVLERYPGQKLEDAAGGGDGLSIFQRRIEQGSRI